MSNKHNVDITQEIFAVATIYGVTMLSLDQLKRPTFGNETTNKDTIRENILRIKSLCDEYLDGTIIHPKNFKMNRGE